nr:AAA family ATPase [uncultured Pseudogulbenkiania sp.]
MHFSEISISGVRAVYAGSYKEKSEIKINPGLVNIIIGENGAGKSTILDAIHSLCDDGKLCELQTENTISDSVADCLFVRGAYRINLKFSQYGLDFFNFQNVAILINNSLKTKI